MEKGKRKKRKRKKKSLTSKEGRTRGSEGSQRVPRNSIGKEKKADFDSYTPKLSPTFSERPCKAPL